MTEESPKTSLSRPAAYGLFGAAAAGTTILAFTAPSVLAAGAGSVSSSAAVFLTPVWRFIKHLNELYVDVGMYLQADAERLRNLFRREKKDTAQAALQAHKPVFTRTGSYTVLGATLLSAGFLALYMPMLLATAFGSIAVSGASFTQPVLDLVEHVNLAYRDIYNFVRQDIFGYLPQLPSLIPVEENTDIDRSISAPLTPPDKPMSRLTTYGLLALSVLGGTLLAATAPSVLLAAGGTILGSAISYTSPVLKLVKKVNKVYDTAEDRVVEGFEPAKPLVLETVAEKQKMGQQGLVGRMPRFVGWILAGAALAGIGALAVVAPLMLTAAAGSILGSASSFTTPVLKQVGRVNSFYADVKRRLKEDWELVFKGKSAPAPVPATTPAPEPGDSAPTAPPLNKEGIDLQKVFAAKAPVSLPQKEPAPAQPAHGTRPRQNGA